MLPTAMTIWSSKGGAGKTTLTAALAVATAQENWRTLAIDLDTQGNLSRALGYVGHPEWDGGQALYDALATQGRQPLRVISGVRDNLDVIGGGPAGEGLVDVVSVHLSKNPIAGSHLLDQLLAPLAGNYDLILLDLPPSPTALHHVALTTAHYVVCPTTPSPLDTDGIATALRIIGERRDATNPDLEVLGIVMNKVDLSAKRALRTALDDIAAMTAASATWQNVEVLQPPIRASQATDSDMKTAGIVPIELTHDDVREARRQRFKWLGQGRKGPPPPSITDTVRSMGDDLDVVLAQIVARYSAGQRAWLAKAGVA